MRILITGGSGFLGSLLARTMLAQSQLSLAGQDPQLLDELVLTDLLDPPGDLRSHPKVRFVTGDLNDLLAQGRLPLADVAAVVHLAAAVSGECEADLDLGLRSNLDATLALLQALRQAGHAPLVVYASSVAVFGGVPGQPVPECIADLSLPTPQSSYGIQKFMGEQLVADFTRRGLVQGRNVRLMTVAVRPGRPNGAASGFLSGMVREPLVGQRATVPVSPATAVALASPDNTVAGLMRALAVDAAQWGPCTAVNLPALTTTVGDVAAALGRLAGQPALDLLDWVPDERIAAIVGGWPSRFHAARAAKLGLLPDESIDTVLRQYVSAHPNAVVLTC